MTPEPRPRPSGASPTASTLALERAEAHSARLAAVYSALAAVHAIASRPASTTAELFERACNSLIKDRIYPLAWWGQQVDEHTVRVQLIAGESAVPPPDQLAARGTSEAWVRALREKSPAVIRRESACSDPLLEQFGITCVLVVPVPMENSAHGVLCVGAPNGEDFDSHETALLVELGRSLTTHIERLSAERALAAQRELLRAVFDCATYGIYYATAEGQVLLCNDAFLRLTASPRDKVLGQNYQTVSAPEYKELEEEIVARVLSTGLPSEYDKDLVRPDGFRIPVRLSVAPVRHRSGRPVGTVAVVRDTVAERAAANALRESEERYRAAFRNNPDAIFVIDAENRIVDANPAATALTGLSHEALLGRTLPQLAAPSEMESHQSTYQALKKDGAVYRPLLRFVNLGRESIDSEVHGTHLGPQLWQVLVRDIRARVEAENKLLALKDRLEEKVLARTRELKEANEQLAHSGHMKEQFLANMSHELRTPLNSVLGLADALLEGVFGDLDDQQRQILMTMHDSGQHLLALINDILDLSKIEAGRLELDMRSISVPEVCQTSLRVVRTLALSKRIETWMRLDPSFPIVVADERRLKQMLVNLLSNAVKFTPAGGKVGIEAWKRDERVYFSVTDTGIGIAARDLRRIFEPFTQIDSSLSRQHEGTGLGLALVRRLTELHGGHVDVDSEPKRGSRFTIVLPRIPLPDRETLLPMEER